MKARSSLAIASGAAASVGVSLTILTSHLLFALAQFAWQRMDCDGSDTNPCPQNMPPGGLLRGVLAHCSDNWSHTALEGGWRQARAVRRVLRASDKALALKLERLEGANAAEQPLAFLFGPIFLRLKRELLVLGLRCPRSGTGRRRPSAG